MIDIHPPPLAVLPVALSADRQLRNGSPLALPRDLTGMVSLGLPVVLPLDEGALAADPDLVTFVRVEALAHRFVLVHLAVTFQSGTAGTRVRKAWAEVTLDGSVNPQDIPIVWSMQPTRSQETEETERTIKVGAKLALVDVSLERGDKRTRRTTTVEAFGLQQSVATWQLAEPDRGGITGSHRLSLIARLPPAECRGSVALKVEVEQRRFGIFGATAKLPGGGASVEL